MASDFVAPSIVTVDWLVATFLLPGVNKLNGVLYRSAAWQLVGAIRVWVKVAVVVVVVVVVGPRSHTDGRQECSRWNKTNMMIVPVSYTHLTLPTNREV